MFFNLWPWVFPGGRKIASGFRGLLCHMPSGALASPMQWTALKQLTAHSADGRGRSWARESWFEER
jgi:hypothetical protein